MQLQPDNYTTVNNYNNIIVATHKKVVDVIGGTSVRRQNPNDRSGYRCCRSTENVDNKRRRLMLILWCRWSQTLVDQQVVKTSRLVDQVVRWLVGELIESKQNRWYEVELTSCPLFEWEVDQLIVSRRWVDDERWKRCDRPGDGCLHRGASWWRIWLRRNARIFILAKRTTLLCHARHMRGERCATTIRGTLSLGITRTMGQQRTMDSNGRHFWILWDISDNIVSTQRPSEDDRKKGR